MTSPQIDKPCAVVHLRPADLSFALLVLLFSQLLFTKLSYASSAIPTNSSLAQLAESYGTETRFVIERKGKRIGTHMVRFEQQGDTTVVTVESDIKVTVLKIPVYRFHYQSIERWREDRLLDVLAIATENGKSNTVSYESSAENPVDFASNHWHNGIVNAKRVFNTLTGEINTVNLTAVGEETLQLGNTAMLSRHYQYSGDIDADVWYDEHGLWAKLQFTGEDGSVISYLRE